MKKKQGWRDINKQGIRRKMTKLKCERCEQKIVKCQFCNIAFQNQQQIFCVGELGMHFCCHRCYLKYDRSLFVRMAGKYTTTCEVE